MFEYCLIIVMYDDVRMLAIVEKYPIFGILLEMLVARWNSAVIESMK